MYKRQVRTIRALQFYREKISALSCLVDPRRIGPTHARRSQELIDPIWFYFCKFKISALLLKACRDAGLHADPSEISRFDYYSRLVNESERQPVAPVVHG